MKFEINYSIGDYNDLFTIEGDTINDIKRKAKVETDKRGLTEIENNLWSREIFN